LKGRGRAYPAAIALGLASFAFYCLTGSGHSSFGDGYLLFHTARSLLDRGGFAIDPVTGVGRAAQRVGREGQTFAIFAPAYAFAEIPAIVAGRRLPAALQPKALGEAVDDLRRDEFWAMFTNSWVAAATVAFVYLSGLALHFSPGASLTNAGLLAVASPLWCFARTDASEALQALFLVAAAYALIGADHRSWRLFAGGTLLAAAVLAKLANAALAPLYLVFCAARYGRRRFDVRDCLAVILPVTAAVLLYGGYDALRFGSVWDTGYDLPALLFGESRARGVWTLVASPSNGIVFFWPLSLLVPLGAGPIWRSDPRLAFIAVATPIVLLLVYAGNWGSWQFAWGPRFLVPAIPLLSLLLLPVLSSRSRVLRVAVVAGGVLGLGVELITVSVSWWHQVFVVWRSVQRDNPLQAFLDPRLAPLRIGWWWLRIVLAEHLIGYPHAALVLREPPWRAAFPWRDTETLLPRLWNLRGLDLWAAPTGWRMPYRPITRLDEGISPIASSPLLAVVFLVVFAVALGALLRELRQAAACESADDVP